MVLGICGRGGSAREVLELALQINEVDKRWTDIVFIGDKIEENYINGKKVYLLDDSLEAFGKENIEYVISFGEPRYRANSYQELKNKGAELATLINPNVHVPQNSSVGEGVIIASNAFISVNVVIGNNVFIQPNTVIGHDTCIGHDSVISALSAIPGNCSIGQQTYIALNCTVKENVSIGDAVIVSMGSVVNKDAGNGVVLEGKPAKIISKNYLHQVFHL